MWLMRPFQLLVCCKSEASPDLTTKYCGTRPSIETDGIEDLATHTSPSISSGQGHLISDASSHSKTACSELLHSRLSYHMQAIYSLPERQGVV